MEISNEHHGVLDVLFGVHQEKFDAKYSDCIFRVLKKQF